MRPLAVMPRSTPPSGLSRQGLRRWALVRFVCGVTAGILLVLATSVALTSRAERSLGRERQRRALELVRSVADAVEHVEPDGLPWTRRPDPSIEQELRERIVTLRQVDRDIRSVFLLAHHVADDDWRVLVASTASDSEWNEGDVVSGARAVPVFEARRAPVVTPIPDGAGGSIAAFSPIRSESGATIGIAGVTLGTEPLALERAALRRDGWLVSLALSLGMIAIGSIRFRRRLAELERARSMQAEISIHRVGETLARVEKDEDLVRCALDAIAEGSGIAHWAMYLRDERDGRLALFAVRGLPDEARPELSPDTPGRDARSPAARAAWLREVVIVRDPAALPDYAFPALTPALGPRPVIVAVPLSDESGTMAVLECFVPRRRHFESDDLALIRWMATQVSVGLKRIRMERRTQMLASFSMGTGEILLGLDLGGAITHANPAAEKALGVEPGALDGCRVETLLEGAGAVPWRDAAFEGDFSGEVWFRRPSGGRFPAEIRVSPTRDRDGTRLAFVLVGHDVSERREREIEIANRTQELALLNDQLQAANEELELARRMQSEFVANTSHELRTPLNAVIGFATLIEQGALESPTESAEFAAQIRQSAEHLLGLLNDILDLAKVEAGRFELTVSLGDARGPIQAAVDAISPIALGRGLNLLVDLPVTPLLVRHDTSRLRQVMMNLLGNAVKFTDTGDVRVSAVRDDRTGETRIVVEDSGVGIAPEKQGLLFSKFTQLDGSYARRHGGTGLGLAISRALMQNMGGSIRVESEGIGHGTRATLVFPPPNAVERSGRPVEATRTAGSGGRA